MIYIIDQPPNYCPQCARDLRPLWKTGNRSDFHAHASFSCPCGAQYQKVTTALILNAADEEGDLKQHNS
jgi:hypothetical protein